MRNLRLQQLGSARTVLTIGMVLGLVITIGLSITVWQDRTARVDSARRQSLALAAGADRLLHYELRNLERAMSGIVADADAYRQTVPGQAPALISEAIEGVVSRHSELHSIVLQDTLGNALSNGKPDRTLANWSTFA
ncbi:MAG: phosphodiesterase, partial [Oxalobacteraceae bacterium]